MDVPLDVGDHFEGGLLNVVHVLAVGVLPELLGGPDDQVHAVNAAVASDLGILHVTPDVCEAVNWAAIEEGWGKSRIMGR